jgi:predicted dehydrogenase
MNAAHPEQPVRWGILGTAKIASKVGRAIHDSRGSRLTAVASRDIGRARTWIADHTVGRPEVNGIQPFLPAASTVATYGSYLELLRDPDVDAVYIPLPPSLHCEWTCRAAEHGKHVLCEKPLALNLAEAEQMAEACRLAKRQLMDCVMWVHHDRTNAMQSELSSGTLGRLRRVTSAFTYNAVDIGSDNIRFQRELGGGSLGDVGWYCVRATLWALGDLPERVWATARYERGVDMNLSAELWFRGERMASFDCGFDTNFRKWFEIAGTEGSLVCDDFVNPWDFMKARYWIHKRGKSVQHDFPACLQEVRMVESFCDGVRSGSLNSKWPQAAIDTQRISDAIARAARTGKAVSLGVHGD